MQQDIVRQDLTRVLVISLGSLVDIAHNIAALEAIRKYHTNAHITLITEPEYNRFMSACPFVDEVTTNWRTNGLRQELNFTNTLQRASFEMVYDLAQTEESEGIYKKYWLKKPMWSGIAMGCSHPFVDRARTNMHPLDRIAEQLWLCGIGPKEGYPIGAAPLPNLKWALEPNDYHTIPEKFGIDGNYAILVPEAAVGRPGDIWSVARFVELAGELISHDIKPVLMGTHRAIAVGNEIRAQLRGIDDLIGRVDVFEYLSLARASSLIVGSNSELVVLAGLVGAPTVSIINPEAANIRQVAPRGKLTVSVVARDFKDIKVEQVINAARAVRD